MNTHGIIWLILFILLVASPSLLLTIFHPREDDPW